MNYFWMTTFVAFFAAGILLLMWKSWQRGKAQGMTAREHFGDANGEMIETFKKVLYVSTTRAGEPLVRVQHPGLRYRGYADVEVHSDGINICVTGEEPTWLAAQQIDDVQQVQMRIGKVVEKGGLAAVSWHTSKDNLESSFRFQETQDQINFMNAVRQINAGSNDSE